MNFRGSTRPDRGGSNTRRSAYKKFANDNQHAKDFLLVPRKVLPVPFLSHADSLANTSGQGVTKTCSSFLNGEMKTVAGEAENNPFYGPQKSEVTMDEKASS